MNNQLNSLRSKLNITRTDLVAIERLNYQYLSAKNNMGGIYKGMIDSNLKDFTTGKVDKMFGELQAGGDLDTIFKKYNENWLKTEGQTVEEVIESAKEMEQVIGETEEYDIQWITAEDEKVRPDHVRMNNMILDSNDLFWQQYGLPPQEYNCRCTYIKVPKGRGRTGDTTEGQTLKHSLVQEKEKLGIGNPFEGVIFNRNHNYFK